MIKRNGFCGVKFWLQRLSEEYAVEAKRLIDESQLLTWQSYNLDEMPLPTQEKVISDLIERMNKRGWEKSAKELEENEEKHD